MEKDTKRKNSKNNKEIFKSRNKLLKKKNNKFLLRINNHKQFLREILMIRLEGLLVNYSLLLIVNWERKVLKKICYRKL